MQTPGPRNVRWDVDDTINSPASNASTEFVSTSSLQYINSQLVAHGFTAAPGLSLDGVASADMEKAVKCLLAMLSQRVEDMSRTEDLSTRLRTLNYDHERLKSMHNTAEEKAASAEREMNAYKSRLATATKALQASETAHKHTTAELQRTRTSLQSIRTLHQNELKKKDKEIDRMAEKWAKLSEVQSRLSAVSSGMRCLNGGLADAAQVVGPTNSFLETSLEESERARMEIMEENKYVKQLMLNAVNEMQDIVHHTGEDERMQHTLMTLFPIAPATAARDAISDTLTAIRAIISRLSHPEESSDPTPSSSLSSSDTKVSDEQVTRLQDTIKHLQSQIDNAQADQVSDTPARVDTFSNNRRLAKGHTGKVSVESIDQPEREEEHDRLHSIDNRKKFAEAAGEERAAMEVGSRFTVSAMN
ncbi:Afadin and alpha-actinin-binding-domain-containing protein [Schizophyllum amplum]|uniref:Afadin and alpha-actinin-binding-domain-containing protein n=1 Tax=Schizophyllum amplum TaxID=97359 RepID=A0A550C1P9_9AGAR|nr:Afadin and alpha-actinin-binding-domain-containing protein [Auriculariopsis ampla]